MRYRFDRKSYNRRTRLLSSAAVVAVLAIIAFVGVSLFLRQEVISQLRPISTNTQIVYFTVEKGSSAKQISIQLEDAGLIRSSSAFQWYVRTKELRDDLKAGTYTFNRAMSVQEMVDKMVNGEVARNLFTILPGKRLD